MDFIPFPKLPRLSREIVITEKIDGTNACIAISDTGCTMLVGSRTRWITPDDDNYGFARWAQENRDELMKLGPGRHYGEWWGQGIQRRYDLAEKRFSLFNVARWQDNPDRPACCHVVPTLYRGPFTTHDVHDTLTKLQIGGSVAAPGFMRPEGIVVFHTAANLAFKKTIEKDEQRKTEWEPNAA